MHIIVCVKQTPAGENVSVDQNTGCIIRSGESALNPFDEFAIEEAVRVKEKTPGSKVTAVTMGPPQAEAVLREAVARGCDGGVHVCGREFAGSDTWATSYALSQAVKKLSENDPSVLVFCGKQTNDSDTGHIGPQMAQWLGWPGAAFVRNLEAVDGKSVRVQRLMEDGYDVVEMPLPAVLSVIKEINTPRIASLKGRLASKKAQFPKWSAAELGCDPAKLGLDGSPTSVVRCFTPPQRASNTVKIQGETAADKARNLAAALKEAKIL